MLKALNNYAQGGFDVLNSDEIYEIVEYIEANQEICPVELYRGIMVADFEVEIGETIYFKEPFASFDEDIEVAEQFATRRGKGVVFILRDDSFGLPVYMHANTCHGETEWLILDVGFVVEAIEQNEENENIIYVRIRPAET